MREPERIEVPDALLHGLARTWGAEITAFGSRRGSPFLATVAEGGGRLFPVALPGSGVVTSVAGSEETLATAQVGDEVRLFGISLPDESGPRLHARAIDDEYTRSAARAWVTCGSEDPAYVIVDPEGRLRGVDPGGEGWLPENVQLRLTSPHAPLVVQQEEVSLLVAGHLEEAGSEARPSAWYLDDLGFREVLPEVEITGFSDIDGHHVDLFLAGHHAGRPVVLDTHGRALPSPPVELDAQRPTVLVAHGPFERGPSPSAPEGWTTSDARGLLLVVQARQGIEAWGLFPEGWRTCSLPGETLQAARVTTPLWFIADHALWLFQGLNDALRASHD